MKKILSTALLFSVIVGSGMQSQVTVQKFEVAGIPVIL